MKALLRLFPYGVALPCLSLLLVILQSNTKLYAQLPSNWPADYPAWWYNSTDPTSGVINATLTPLNQNNNALLNQGQLWNLTAQGIAELDATLATIGGADFTLEDFRDPTQAPAYQSPANIGQLKHISSKFFDRFASIGFEPGEPGWPTTLTLNLATGYPWSRNQSSTNTDLANIGQAKHLFSWDTEAWFSAVMATDSDDDGLPDFWEYYWGDLSLNPNGDLDADGRSNLVELMTGSNPSQGNAQSEVQNDSILPQYQGLNDLVLNSANYGVFFVSENESESSLSR